MLIVNVVHEDSMGSYYLGDFRKEKDHSQWFLGHMGIVCIVVDSYEEVGFLRIMIKTFFSIILIINYNKYTIRIYITI
jgi:hypothetical protein